MVGQILQPTHALLLLAVVMLFFGAKRLPELARAIGESIRHLRAFDDDDKLGS